MVITNNGLDMFGSMFPITYCNVGTGTLGADLTGATGLNNYAFNVAGGSAPASTISRTSSAPFYAERTNYWVKNNIAQAYTLTEISLGNSASNSQVFCIDKLRDINGNPTSIQVLAGDTLQVSAKIRLYADPTPITGTIAANADMPEQQFTVVPNFINWNILSFYYIGQTNFSCDLSTSAFNPDITVAATGTGSTQNAVWEAYTSGTHYRDVTFNMGTADGNIGTIVQIITVGAGWSVPNPIKIGLNPGFIKNSTYTASFTLRFSWGRYVQP